MSARIAAWAVVWPAAFALIALAARLAAWAHLFVPGLAVAVIAVLLLWVRPALRILGGHQPTSAAAIRAAVLIATAFGVGRTPKAPGTAGTAAGLVVVAATASLPIGAQAALVALVIGVGAVAAEIAARHTGEPDASWIVVDEVAGMMVAVLGVPFHPVVALVAFALFRAADVYKPFPCRWIDDHVPTGPGTMLDDVFAGLWVAAGLHTVRLLAGS